MTAFLARKHRRKQLNQNSAYQSTVRQFAPEQPTGKTLNKSEVLGQIASLAPAHTPAPQDPQILRQLAFCCQELIKAYGIKAEQPSPFSEVYQKSVYLYESAIQQEIANKVILVTGGSGCVGQLLIDRLRAFAPAQIIAVDLVPHPTTTGIISYMANVSDRETMEQIFAHHRPALVFHLAAERDPSIAERTGITTVHTNIFGTQTIINLCEEFAVEKCIFASTGKAARYFTPDIYAGSKKICEYLFTNAATAGQVIYGAVRFTHIAENSIVSAHIDHEIHRGIVSLHSPERYIYAQNGSEAVNLLLNALVFAKRGCLKILTVRDLGWPIDILELALHKIAASGTQPPLYFRGLPSGYEDQVFAGHYDWVADNFSPMINFLESHTAVTDSSGDMAIWTALSFVNSVLESELHKLQEILELPNLSNSQIKIALAQSVEAMMLATFVEVPLHQLQRVLALGINPKDVVPIEKTISLHSEIIGALLKAIGYQENRRKFNSNQSGIDLLDLWAAPDPISN